MSSDKSGVPPVLYHYCGVNGFKGIIESKCLWLSHAGYMNDYMEHAWLFEKAKKHFDRLAGEGHKEYAKFMSIGDPGPSFICCFSSECDLLSQWRAYSDDGAGFAIGFSMEEELSKGRYRNVLFPLRRVIYDEAEQDTEIERALGDSYSRFEVGTDNDDSIAALGRLVMLASSCKNPGFHEEQEWRLIFLNPGLTELRPRFRVNAKNQLVPYFEFAFALNAISEIRLGPKNSARSDHETLKRLLAANDYPYDKIKILNSEATYR